MRSVCRLRPPFVYVSSRADKHPQRLDSPTAREFELAMAAQVSSSNLGDHARAEVADLLHLQLSPIGLAAMDALDPQPGQTIVDIGCGAGQTTQQLANRVGSLGRVIGVDIAPRVLDVARSRTATLAQVQLIQADAATLALPDEMADGVYSRFGVMALDDPVAAFANFRRMTRRGGRLAFVCWEPLARDILQRVGSRAVLGLGQKSLNRMELSNRSPGCIELLERDRAMNPPDEFLKHAADCEQMAKFARDAESKATWNRMAERWRRCAEKFTTESLGAHHARLAKGRRGVAPDWAHH